MTLTIENYSHEKNFIEKLDNVNVWSARGLSLSMGR